jgi:uncharacterized SAM-binding protein YcdF (DUF218 family)
VTPLKGLVAILVAAAIWASGFLAFVERVERSTPAPTPPLSDGVVALTGAGSNERIGAAMQLLEDGRARRMLVSGVNREASREDIRTVSKAVRRLYDCCVDLGFDAANTIGNARETAEWSRAMRYDSLIVVTADYHMPRAMLELRGAMPDKRLTPYPVATSVVDPKRWWRSTGSVRLMVGEYAKYLAILLREAVLSLGPREDAAAKKG